MLGSKVEAYDAGTPLVTLDSGQLLTAHLIVAADGEIAWTPGHWKRLTTTQASIQKRRKSLATRQKARNQRATQHIEQQ